MSEPNEENVCPCLQLRKADRNISRIFDSWMRPTGLRISQYGMLSCIARLEKPSISEIGVFLSMDQTTVTRNIMKLEGSGFVQSSPDPRNGHKKLVELTDKGKNMLASARGAWKAAQASLRQRLDKDEYKMLLVLLDKLADFPER